MPPGTGAVKAMIRVLAFFDLVYAIILFLKGLEAEAELSTSTTAFWARSMKARTGSGLRVRHPSLTEFE